MTNTSILSYEQLINTNGVCDLTGIELATLSSFTAMLHRRKPPARYLEIGVFGGGTMRWLKNVIPGIQCTGVDLFESFTLSADNTHVSGNYTMQDVQSFVGQDARLIMGDSSIVLPTLGEEFDVIFIDGNHSYTATRTDLENSVRLLAKGGVIAMHNCSIYGSPDWQTYNMVDGGPWQVMIEMMQDDRYVLLSHTDRICVFALRA